MPSEKELVMYQKATVLDLIQILKKDPDRSYTLEELEALMMAYVQGLEQKYVQTGRNTGPSVFFTT